MIKAVLFDFFGVVTTVDVSISFIREVSGGDLGKQLYLRELFRLLDTDDITLEELLTRLADEAGQTKHQVFDRLNSKIKINDRVVKLMKLLKPKYRVGLLTNANASWIRPILDQNDLTELFDAITISSEVGTLKPAKEIYLDALMKLGVTASETLYIDDRPEYVEGARSVGIKAIQFHSAGQLDEYLSKEVLIR